jgi:hypothetical protein
MKEIDLRNIGVSATGANLLDADERFLLALLRSGSPRETSP